jgi:hypothetical protein
MDCSSCKQASSKSKESINETWDHFERFYGRYLHDARYQAKHGHRYQRPTFEGETRLFALSPGTAEDPISGSLDTVFINDPPLYTALSYVWGHERAKSIQVDGQEFQARSI